MMNRNHALSVSRSVQNAFQSDASRALSPVLTGHKQKLHQSAHFSLLPVKPESLFLELSENQLAAAAPVGREA